MNPRILPGFGDGRGLGSWDEFFQFPVEELVVLGGIEGEVGLVEPRQPLPKCSHTVCMRDGAVSGLLAAFFRPSPLHNMEEHR